MATSTRTVNVEDITQQSKERLNDRVTAAELLAVAHNARANGEQEAKRRRDELEAELTETLRALEQDHKAAFETALKAGWTQRDLRAMGLAVPAKPRGKRQRRKTVNTTPSPDQSTTNVVTEDEQMTAPAGDVEFTH